jgi:Glycosyltransferase
MFLNMLTSSLQRATRLVTLLSHKRPSANGGDDGQARKPRFAEERRIIEEAGLFDAEFYRSKYPDVTAAGIDPLEHYIEWGGEEGRRPHPLFDPHWYTTQYPDVTESGIHPLIHYLTIGKKEGRRCGLDSRILSAVGAMYQEAGSFEPAIMLDSALAEPYLLNIHGGGRHWPALRVWRALFDSLKNPFDYIVFLAGPLRTEAERVAANVVKAAIEAHGLDSTLVVSTDDERSEAGNWLPNAVHMRGLSDFGTALTRADRASIVEKLILAIRPKAVLNVDSAACWDAIVRKGAALRLATDLYACLRSDSTANGLAADYAHTHFREALPFLRKLYFDDVRFKDDLAYEYGVPASLRNRLVTLYQPVRGAAIGTYNGGPSNRNAVVWAGHICSQRNIDLLLKIAAQAPELLFDVFGNGSDYDMKRLSDAAKSCPNLTLKGPFSSASQLPLNNYSAFLYTSLSDGLPLDLAEVSLTGIPVVASAVGGIAELVTPTTGWLIDRFREPEPYIHALREIKDKSQLAMAKSKCMVERVQDQHSWAKFVSVLRVSPSFVD